MKYAHPFIAGCLVGPPLPPRFLIPQGIIELDPVARARSSDQASLLFRQTRGEAMSADTAIERILELSAEAQIKRREAAQDSPAFHSLTGAIVAYGKALGLLSKLKEVQTELCSNN
jgi:hypothetical protein